MKDVSVSQEAQVALVRLLGKLGLVSAVVAEQPWCGTDYCPIAHFAKQGQLSENEALSLVSQKLSIPLFVFEHNKIGQLIQALEHQALNKITVEQWLQMRAAPVEVSSLEVTVAAANPLDQALQKSLEFRLGRSIKLALAREDEILNFLLRRASSSYTIDLNSLIENSGAIITPAEETSRAESHHTADDIAAPPVVRLANKILADAVRADASDIHLNPEKDNLTVKIRVDGILRTLFAVPNNFKQTVLSRLKLLSGMDIAERRKPQDGRLRIKTDYGLKDLRFSTIPTLHGENIVIRVLTPDLTKVTFEALGVDAPLQEKFSMALSSSAQVFLVTGPTGCGKTSTLYAALLRLRDGTTNIVTIEDPIEYRIQGVNQIQVNPKTEMTFAQGLRSLLRQDPDVIMVGEIRDYETGATAMQAAQTGHLVLSSLHANSAAAAVTRLRDLGVPAYLLSASLGTVVAQRLVRKLCRYCAVPLRGIDLSPYLGLGLRPDCMRAAAGCEECGGTGFKGRTGVFSFLPINDSVREAIRLELGEQEIEARARSAGFRSLLEVGIDILNQGISSLDELERSLGPMEALAASAGLGGARNSPRDAASGAGGAVSSVPRRRVLLVDDDENTRVVLSLLLQREMFEVVEAQDGLEALEKVYQDPPQIIVSDLMMPRMNGLEMLQKLRHDSRVSSIPVLMLTAADSESNEIHLLDSGADDFVSKGADSKLMLARIHRLLERGPNNT